MITIEDFLKLEIKTGRVIEAQRVEGSNKLIVIKVDIGGEVRQIVAGIGKVYLPEELTNKTIIVITNLKPAKLMGIESQGMLLAATDENGRLSILTTDREVNPGALIR